MNDKKPETEQKIPPTETPPTQLVSGPTSTEKTQEGKKSPEFSDVIKKWIYKRYGIGGLGVLALLVLGLGAWWSWEKVRTLPGVRQVLELIARAPIPKADPSKYSVGVALFDNDPSGEHHRIVVAALTSFEGIQVLEFERFINPRGADATAAEQAGHAKAREYLRESGAQALIWGEVLTRGQESVPRLFWTVAQEGPPVKAAGRYLPSKEMELPQIFWSDLKDVLVLVAATQAAEFGAQSGQYIADRLKPFIEKTRNLVNRSRGSAEMSAEQRTRLLVLFADSLSTFGEQAGDSGALEEAIRAYGEALKGRTREKVPLDWAMTQNNLGTALGSLGERESGTARLKEAVGAFREALKEYTQEKVPLDWAMTQNNLGNALGSLGERESGTARLEEAVGAFREALKERTREKVPLQWAMATENLELVLGVLAIRQSNQEDFCASIVERLRALEEYRKAGAEYYEKTVVRSIAGAIEQMKTTFGEEAFESCRARHAALFGSLRLERKE